MMNINEVFMFIIKDSHDRIIIDKTIFERLTNMGAMPILWCRDGLFCVIPEEVTLNALNSAKSFQQIDLKQTPPVVEIHWSQGIPISNQVGRALVGE